MLPGGLTALGALFLCFAVILFVRSAGAGKADRRRGQPRDATWIAINGVKGGCGR
jgi:hypothetical protein